MLLLNGWALENSIVLINDINVDIDVLFLRIDPSGMFEPPVWAREDFCNQKAARRIL